MVLGLGLCYWGDGLGWEDHTNNPWRWGEARRGGVFVSFAASTVSQLCCLSVIAWLGAIVVVSEGEKPNPDLAETGITTAASTA